jgi:hypothetical protein
LTPPLTGDSTGREDYQSTEEEPQLETTLRSFGGEVRYSSLTVFWTAGHDCNALCTASFSLDGVRHDSALVPHRPAGRGPC